MSWFKTLWRELVGLFVDDAAFAAGILAVLVVVWLGASVLHLPSAWMGGALFAGLAVLLLQSTWTQSRQSRDRPGQ
jgi:hypothetical protein